MQAKYIAIVDYEHPDFSPIGRQRAHSCYNGIRTNVLILNVRHVMNLAQAGIALKCRCGADISAEMIGVLFDDRGHVKISDQPLRCRSCGAIYRRGERLRYRLVRIDNNSQPAAFYG